MDLKKEQHFNQKSSNEPMPKYEQFLCNYQLKLVLNSMRQHILPHNFKIGENSMDNNKETIHIPAYVYQNFFA